MAFAPKFANEFYFKKGHPENKNMSQWFGLALGSMTVAQALASQEKTPNKAVLMASAAQYLSAPVLMMVQKKDMKPEMIALNTVTCGIVGLLCLKNAK